MGAFDEYLRAARARRETKQQKELLTYQAQKATVEGLQARALLTAKDFIRTLGFKMPVITVIGTKPIWQNPSSTGPLATFVAWQIAELQALPFVASYCEYKPNEPGSFDVRIAVSWDNFEHQALAGSPELIGDYLLQQELQQQENQNWIDEATAAVLAYCEANSLGTPVFETVQPGREAEEVGYGGGEFRVLVVIRFGKKKYWTKYVGGGQIHYLHEVQGR